MVANITTFMPSPYLHWFFSSITPSTKFNHSGTWNTPPHCHTFPPMNLLWSPPRCWEWVVVVFFFQVQATAGIQTWRFGRWCSFSIGWFLASMLIFQGVLWKKCHVNISQITMGIVTIWRYHIILGISTKYEEHWTCRSLRTFQKSADTMTSSKSNFNQLALCKNNLN